MTSRQTLTILFYLRREKARTNSEIPIYMRITVNGKRAEMAVHRTINPKGWNKEGGCAKGTRDEAKKLNEYLNALRNRVYDAQLELVEYHEPVEAISIRNNVQGISKYRYTLMEVFDYHNQQLLEKVPEHFSKLTWVRFNTTKKHCQSYLKFKYKTDDIFMTQLNYEFVSGLEHYFKTIRKCNHNTTIKYIKNLKKVVNLAIKNEWLRRDPFIAFSVTLNSVKRDYLSKDELKEIEDLEISMPRLEQVRDIFVFSCYTGLAYADVDRLTADHIRKGIDGEDWIFIQRKKTTTESNIPLLPQAARIIQKYLHNPETNNASQLLPVLSNQKMNAYLKEIGDLAEVKKVITFHLARHTFATTVTLTNGVPIESVGKMLGHRDLRTTQIYAKVIEEKVSEDMKNLRERFAREERKDYPAEKQTG